MRLGLVSDPHVAPPYMEPHAWHGPFVFDDAVVRLQAALRVLAGQGSDAIMMLGDLAHFGDDDSLRRGVDVLAQTDTDVWIVAGDHDIEASPRPFDLAAQAGSRVRLATPEDVRLQARTVLVGVEIEKAAEHYVASPGSFKAAKVRDDLVVVMSHRPILSRAGALADMAILDAGSLENGRELGEAFSECGGAVIVASGHLHVRDVHASGNLLQVTVPALIEDPAEVASLEIEHDGAGISVAVEYLPVIEEGREWPVLIERRSYWKYSYAGGWTRRA